jgi:hypothetical protein
MALDFPNSPTVGATFTSAGVTWTWDGTKWVATGGSGGALADAFVATLSADQTGVVASTWTKVNFNTAAFNQNTKFNTANGRFTPSAGAVQIDASLIPPAASTGGNVYVAIYKNGTVLKVNSTQYPNTIIIISIVDNANGTTDYYECWTYSTSAGVITSNPLSTFFGGFAIAQQGPIGLTGPAGAGGPSPGTPPTVVQTASNNANNATGVTFGVAPTNGNLLVAMTSNASTSVAQTGWTRTYNEGNGTDYVAVFTKTAGASEPTAQNPLPANTGGSAIMCWELHNANVVITTGGTLGSHTTYTGGSDGAYPALVNALILEACFLPNATTTFTGTYNQQTTDATLNTGGGRRFVAGHTDASHTLWQTLHTFSTATEFKFANALLST